jgi:hypothetical protein
VSDLPAERCAYGQLPYSPHADRRRKMIYARIDEEEDKIQRFGLTDNR